MLTIEQVLGTTLKETTDALIPLTKELLEGVSEGMKEVHLNEKKKLRLLKQLRRQLKLLHLL